MAMKKHSLLCDSENMATFAACKGIGYAAVAQLVEHQLPKLRVAGSSPVCRSCMNNKSLSIERLSLCLWG